ncbi:MAG: T9SS type A sorting domain-containing protein [Bacteroidales bacterium]|jgi:hypothetical protein|nr:T9SS type A sorting domain-containing protein [Bacteroidales bacterium]
MNKFTLSILILFVCAISLQAQITQEQAKTIVLEYLQNEVTPSYFLYTNAQEPSEENIVLTTLNEEIIEIEYACWAFYLNEHPNLNAPCQHRYLFVKEDDGNLLELITSNDLGPTDLTEWTLVYVSPEYMDATLSNLSISVGALEPVFSNDIYNYVVNLVEKEEITITATPANPSAIVSGAGTFPLEIGENNFTIHVIAEDNITELDYTIVINNALGVSETDLSLITLIPNPTTGELRVTSYELQVTSIEVFDIYGRAVSTHYSLLTTHYSINISHLPAGLYFVKVYTENGVFVEKIIKK